MKYKWITPLIILLLLVVLPGISWIYLKKGFDYQKGNFDKLKLHAVWPIDSLTARDSCFSIFKAGKVTLLTTGFPKNQARLDTLAEKLKKQFGATHKFTFLVWPGEPITFNSGALITCSPQPGSLDFVKNNLDAPAGFFSGDELMITDARLQVRKYYRLDDPEALKELVTHIALLMPKEKDR